MRKSNRKTAMPTGQAQIIQFPTKEAKTKPPIKQELTYSETYDAMSVTFTVLDRLHKQKSYPVPSEILDMVIEECISRKYARRAL